MKKHSLKVNGRIREMSAESDTPERVNAALRAWAGGAPRSPPDAQNQ